MKKSRSGNQKAESCRFGMKRSLALKASMRSWLLYLAAGCTKSEVTQCPAQAVQGIFHRSGRGEVGRPPALRQSYGKAGPRLWHSPGAGSRGDGAQLGIDGFVGMNDADAITTTSTGRERTDSGQRETSRAIYAYNATAASLVPKVRWLRRRSLAKSRPDWGKGRN